MPSRFEITDELWAAVEPLIPARVRRRRNPGRKAIDDRLVLNGILHVLHTGIGGMEAAANRQPYNWGRDLVATVEPPTDYWTEWKSGFGNVSHVVKSPHQCVYRDPESNYYGNIEFSTCVIEE